MLSTSRAPGNADTLRAAAGPTTAELTRLLYGPDRRRIHGPWRELGADPSMYRQPAATVADQVAASYRRLHRVNQVNRVNQPGGAIALAADPHRLAALHEWTAALDGALTVVAGIHYNLFLGSLIDHDAHEERPLEEFADLRRIGTFLCTELGHGNDAAALETTAVHNRADRTFTLHTPNPAARKFMPNTSAAGGPKTAVVAARLLTEGRDQGVFLFLTPLTDENGPLPGITVRPLPLRPGSPVDHCLTSFDKVVLPQEALLSGDHGRFAGDGTFTSALGSRRRRFLTGIGRVTVGKLCMGASAIGGGRAALAVAVRYAHHRRVTGARPDRTVPVWAHRTHHGPLLEELAAHYAMTALHRATVTRWAGHDRTDPADAAAAERQAAVAKGWITWRTRALLAECRERCGAQGLLPDNGIVTLTMDVEGLITAEGDNLALWAKAGAELLLDEDAPPAAAVHGGDPADPGVRGALLHAVEHRFLTRARTRLREAPTGDGLRRWNAAAPAALAAVTARAERSAAAELLTLARRAEDPLARVLLLDLHQLFTLRRIEAHGGELLSAGLLTPQQVGLLPELAEQSLGRLAGHGRTLVDAFDLPDAFYAARPIANPDYQRAFEEEEGMPGAP
ncbi:acyl-CoA dehydrogenase [Streptomyces luteireticuli]|uniref:acyl-CoA dehydrogenase family protein n=1 Tax=Streptomyces luteireticuli TaxID=173858 RepID=UPI0035577DEE